jgi:hypothetical protein
MTDAPVRTAPGRVAGGVLDPDLGRLTMADRVARGKAARTEVPRDGKTHDLYVRQLRDWKFSMDIDRMHPSGMEIYGELCAWTLARSHARSGDSVGIAAYLGSSDVFEQAIAQFAASYVDQTERDRRALAKPAATGRIIAQRGL